MNILMTEGATAHGGIARSVSAGFMKESIIL